MGSQESGWKLPTWILDFHKRILKTKMTPNWSPKPPEWSQEEYQLLSKTPSDNRTEVDLKTVLEKSDTFPRKFPIDSNRVKALSSIVESKILERNINSAYPVLHMNVLQLYARYILFKRRYGNSIEKSIFNDMDVPQFIDRLLTKRAVSFYGLRDYYILLNGQKGSSAWEPIGTPEESKPLTLSKCLSYEEIKLSAFLSVSSYTHFVNLGDRKNFGVYKNDRETIQDEGVIVGVIGPRLVKKNKMEYEEVLISETQNSNNNGYGTNVQPPSVHRLFSEFYEELCLDYKEFVAYRNALPRSVQRYTTLQDGEVFDNFMYYKRLVFTIDTLLIEANQRAEDKSTTAFIHMVGIGLGAWKKTQEQEKLFMDTCEQRIKLLGKQLYNVGTICFAYINYKFCGRYKHNEIIPIEGHPLKGIKIYICNREPHEKLSGVDSDKLLVVSYAWDGNALPGNEFWSNNLGGSGDSAAASSSQISELHNPFINPKVQAGNLRISTDKGIVTYDDYVNSIHVDP